MYRFLIVLCFFFTAACSSITPSFYKLDVRQGNVLEADKVAQIQTGMTKRQVQLLLGTPLLSDPFNTSRWDYVYAFYPRGSREDGEELHLTVFFDGEIVARVDGADAILAADAATQNDG